MKAYGRHLTTLGLLGAVAASVVGLTVAPVASAAVVQPSPIGDTTVDPIVELTNGIGTPSGYDQSTFTNVVQRVAGTDTAAGGSPARDYLTQWLGGPDTALIEGESDDAAKGARALPAFPSFINVLPQPGGGGGGDSFGQTITRPDSSTTTRYMNFVSAYIGGAQVQLPADYTRGTDYKFWTTATTDQSREFTGWRYITPSDFTSFGFGGNTAVGGTSGIWIFQVATEEAHCWNNTCGTSYPYPQWYTQAGGNYSIPGYYAGTQDSNGTTGALPQVQDCDGSPAPLSGSPGGCYDIGEGTAGARPGLGVELATAMDQTYRNLDGVHTPLVAHTDTDIYAAGHLTPNAPTKNCTYNASAPFRCMLAFTKTTPPHTTTATKPAATTDRGTTTYTQPTPTDTDRQALVTYVNNHPCFAAAFKALMQPGRYGYYGCNVTVNVTNNTYTTTEAPANQPTYTMPNCVGGTLSACESSVTAADASATFNVTQLDAWHADKTQPASAVVSTSPAAGATVLSQSAVSITQNPAAMPIQLPAPQPNETYSAYLTRLQGLGYVGTATSTAETTALDGYGASSPTRVTYPDAAGHLVTLDPVQWPTTAPSVPPDVSLTIRYNPADAPPVASTPPSGGIDFSPLTNLSGACNFPFGVLCWVKGAVQSVEAAPACPGIDWHMPAVNTAVYNFPGGAEYNVNLCYFNDYMSTIRTMISWVLWLGAIWYVGSRLLGIKGGGDPTEAINESYDSLIS